MPSSPILTASHLVKQFGALTAVNDVSFQIEAGENFGLLGPNGAGKSTTIAMLSGLYPPTRGNVTVGAFDVAKEPMQVKRIIGVAPQELALYPTLSARDNLAFFGALYGLSGRTLQERINAVLEIVAMSERARDPVQSFSGGMKRRINLAIALINQPQLLILDEPTVGVDPQSRNHIFESVQRLNREQGMSILYTTHYMEEAERLCRRIAIIDRGQIIAQDTPRHLIEQSGGGIITLTLAGSGGDGVWLEALTGALRQLPTVRAAGVKTDEAVPGAVLAATDGRTRLRIESLQGSDALMPALQLCTRQQVTVLGVEVMEPNLETVFLNLTGKSLRDQQG
jgi:ABC-2 type transport system ATP-binding protein